MTLLIPRKLAIAILLVSGSHTQEQLNCLRNNPRVLNVCFNWYNKIIDPWALSEEEVQSMFKLVSSRFDKAFVVNGLFESQMLPAALSVAKYRAKSNSTVQLYFKNRLPDVNGKNETISLLNGVYNIIRTVNKVNRGTVGGLILQSGLDTYTQYLEVFEDVFGPLYKFTEFKLGMMLDKSRLYKSANPRELFKRLKFLLVHLDIQVSKTSELSADAIISSCDYLQANARLKNITGEIFCWTGYPSKGTTSTGVEGSLDGFHRFWCRIVERLTSNKNHARIIMRSAFDESSTAIPVTGKNEDIDKVHFGWWSRISAVSRYDSDFEEKVELLNNVSLLKAMDSFKCSSTDWTFVLGFIFIVITHCLSLSLIVFVLMKANTRRSVIKNSEVSTEDTPAMEMSSSVVNDHNDQATKMYLNT